MIGRLPALVTTLCLAPLAAQASRVVPADLATTPGNQDSVLPLTLGTFRFQQVYDGSAITPNAAVLNDVSFRRGPSGIAAANSVTLQNVVVLCGPTKVAPGAISTTFAANVGTSQTKVFSGSWTLPAQPMQPGLGPFNVTLKFSQPYRYLRSGDHLLLELQVASNQTVNLYVLDASTGLPGGTVRSYGTKAPLKGGSYTLGCSALGALTRGGQAVLELSLSARYAVAGIFGLSDLAWGPTRLPLDLTAFGAPGNWLSASIDVSVPMSMVQVTNGWLGLGALPLPDVPAATGATVFGQAVILDPASNKLGLVLTDALAMTTPSTATAPYAAVFGLAPASTTGYLLPLANNAPGGLVTRFGGVFP
ncbi:MAG: hypothetical protein R3F30_05930 [Planctomycetota bacterium]